MEAWRKRSATGAVLTGFALGLQQVFEKEREEPAIVMTTSGDPPRDLPVEAEVEHGRPRRSVVSIRPWLLDNRAGAPGPEATRAIPPPPVPSPTATECGDGGPAAGRRHRPKAADDRPKGRAGQRRHRPTTATPADDRTRRHRPDQRAGGCRPAGSRRGASLNRPRRPIRPVPDDDLDLKPTSACGGPEPLYGYVVALELIVVSILNLTVTHGKGAPTHPAPAGLVGLLASIALLG